MAYRTFKADGGEVSQHDLQDKGPWCLTGASYEQTFINKYGSDLELGINPVKANDPYVPDLVNLKTKNLADLKTQNTPFFQSGVRYGIDPQYAVTFNVKDYKRYKEYYPTIDIYFWVSWVVTKFEGSTKISVDEMEGIWMITLSNIETLVKAGSPIHSYAQRIFDVSGNAKGSYVLDLQNKLFTRLK
jgi:hypothetical protein